MMGLTDVSQPLGALGRSTRSAIGEHLRPDPFGTRMVGLTDVSQPLGAHDEGSPTSAIGDHVGPDIFGTWCPQAGKLVGVQ
jgi:hypothetical protein